MMSISSVFCDEILAVRNAQNIEVYSLPSPFFKFRAHIYSSCLVNKYLKERNY